MTKTTQDAGGGGLQIVTQNMFDNAGRLTKIIQDPGSSPHLDLETVYEYDPAGNLLTATDPNCYRPLCYRIFTHIIRSTNWVKKDLLSQIIRKIGEKISQFHRPDILRAGIQEDGFHNLAVHFRAFFLTQVSHSLYIPSATI